MLTMIHEFRLLTSYNEAVSFWKNNAPFNGVPFKENLSDQEHSYILNRMHAAGFNCHSVVSLVSPLHNYWNSPCLGSVNHCVFPNLPSINAVTPPCTWRCTRIAHRRSLTEWTRRHTKSTLRYTIKNLWEEHNQFCLWRTYMIMFGLNIIDYVPEEHNWLCSGRT